MQQEKRDHNQAYLEHQAHRKVLREYILQELMARRYDVLRLKKFCAANVLLQLTNKL